MNKREIPEEYEFLSMFGGLTKDDFFDDCPVCQYEEKRLQTGAPAQLSELKQAFERARDQGAVTSGESSDDNDDSFIL